MGLKARCLGGSSLQRRGQGRGAWCGVQTSCYVRRKFIYIYILFCFLRSLPIVGRHIRGGVSGKCVFLPVLQISTWPFYPLLWNRCSASSQVLFRGYCSMCGCICAVSVGGGKFRIFLCHQS